MLDRAEIRATIFRALDRARELSPDEDRLPAHESAIVLGQGAGLDSMGFVNFVIALEEEMAQVTDRPLCLVEKLNASDVDTDSAVTIGHLIDLVLRGDEP